MQALPACASVAVSSWINWTPVWRTLTNYGEPSLLVTTLQDSNLSPIEHGLSNLMLRRFEDLLAEIVQWRLSGPGDDTRVFNLIEAAWQQAIDGDEAFDGIDAVDHAITDNFLGALGTFLLAIDYGDDGLVNKALEELKTGLDVCAELNLGCIRLGEGGTSKRHRFSAQRESLVPARRDVVAFLRVLRDAADIGHENARLAWDVGTDIPRGNLGAE